METKQVVMQPTIPGSRVLEEVGRLHVQLAEAQRTIEEQTKAIQMLRDEIADWRADKQPGRQFPEAIEGSRTATA